MNLILEGSICAEQWAPKRSLRPNLRVLTAVVWLKATCGGKVFISVYGSQCVFEGSEVGNSCRN